jgi:DNA polymerase (family 10)
MAMNSIELARMFARMGGILEFQGENHFTVNAYRKAARVLNELPDDIENWYRQGN